MVLVRNKLLHKRPLVFAVKKNEDVVFCPLLSAIEDFIAEHKSSATEVSEAASEILNTNPYVWSVHSERTIGCQYMRGSQ